MATKVTVSGVEYTYRYDFFALLQFEQLKKRMEEAVFAEHLVGALMHYACLMANENFTLTLDEFVRTVDTKDAYDALNDAFQHEYARWENLSPMPASPDDKVDASKKK
jgi:hypothetical protein